MAKAHPRAASLGFNSWLALWGKILCRPVRPHLRGAMWYLLQALPVPSGLTSKLLEGCYLAMKPEAT